MKKIIIATILVISLAACSRPQYYGVRVRREYTCRFMQSHPIKDTIDGDLGHSYIVKYHAGLYPDEMCKCEVRIIKNK